MSMIVLRRATSDTAAKATAQGMENAGVEVFTITVDRHGNWHVWGKSRAAVDQIALDRSIEKTAKES